MEMGLTLRAAGIRDVLLVQLRCLPHDGSPSKAWSDEMAQAAAIGKLQTQFV